MSTHTLAARTDIKLPSVNLLPPEIAEARRTRRAQAAMSAAVLLAVAVVGGLYYQAHRDVREGQATLAAAHAEQARLQGQVRSYRGVAEVQAELSARAALLAEAMGQEIQWSGYLNDLSLKIPANVWLTSMTASQGTSGVTPVGAGAPTIGTITFGGTAFTHDDVATWLDGLATEKGYTNPYFTSSSEAQTAGRNTVTFSSTVQLTPDALSGRYSTRPGG